MNYKNLVSFIEKMESKKFDELLSNELSNGKDISSLNKKNGNSLLHYACMHNNYKVVETLIEKYGLAHLTSSKNNKSQTPLDLFLNNAKPNFKILYQLIFVSQVDIEALTIEQKCKIISLIESNLELVLGDDRTKFDVFMKLWQVEFEISSSAYKNFESLVKDKIMMFQCLVSSMSVKVERSFNGICPKDTYYNDEESTVDISVIGDGGMAAGAGAGSDLEFRDAIDEDLDYMPDEIYGRHPIFNRIDVIDDEGNELDLDSAVNFMSELLPICTADTLTSKGETPLVYILKKNVFFLNYLPEGLIPGSIDAQDSDGKTALHYASLYGISHWVRILLKQGANIDIIDNSGKKAIDYATGRIVRDLNDQAIIRSRGSFSARAEDSKVIATEFKFEAMLNNFADGRISTIDNGRDKVDVDRLINQKLCFIPSHARDEIINDEVRKFQTGLIRVKNKLEAFSSEKEKTITEIINTVEQEHLKYLWCVLQNISSSSDATFQLINREIAQLDSRDKNISNVHDNKSQYVELDNEDNSAQIFIERRQKAIDELKLKSEKLGLLDIYNNMIEARLIKQGELLSYLEKMGYVTSHDQYVIKIFYKHPTHTDSYITAHKSHDTYADKETVRLSKEMLIREIMIELPEITEGADDLGLSEAFDDVLSGEFDEYYAYNPTEDSPVDVDIIPLGLC